MTAVRFRRGPVPSWRAPYPWMARTSRPPEAVAGGMPRTPGTRPTGRFTGWRTKGLFSASRNGGHCERIPLGGSPTSGVCGPEEAVRGGAAAEVPGPGCDGERRVRLPGLRVEQRPHTSEGGLNAHPIAPRFQKWLSACQHSRKCGLGAHGSTAIGAAVSAERYGMPLEVWVTSEGRAFRTEAKDRERYVRADIAYPDWKKLVADEARRLVGIGRSHG